MELLRTRRDMLKQAVAIGAIVMMGGMPSMVHAAGADKTIFQRNGLAIDGYDTVAYFTQSDALKGTAKYKADYKGAVWHFLSAENRDLFIANPKKYAPQYEGYCAYAAANGAVAKTEPDEWSVVNGKLYLNYNALIKLRWDVSQSDFIKDGDKKWPGVRPGNKTGRPY